MLLSPLDLQLYALHASPSLRCQLSLGGFDALTNVASAPTQQIIPHLAQFPFFWVLAAVKWPAPSMHLEERFHLNALRLCGRVISGSGASLRHVCNCRAHWFADFLSLRGLSWARDANTYTLDRRPPVVIAGAGGVAGAGETDVVDCRGIYPCPAVIASAGGVAIVGVSVGVSVGVGVGVVVRVSVGAGVGVRVRVSVSVSVRVGVKVLVSASWNRRPLG